MLQRNLGQSLYPDRPPSSAYIDISPWTPTATMQQTSAPMVSVFFAGKTPVETTFVTHFMRAAGRNCELEVLLPILGTDLRPTDTLVLPMANALPSQPRPFACESLSYRPSRQLLARGVHRQ